MLTARTPLLNCKNSVDQKSNNSTSGLISIFASEGLDSKIKDFLNDEECRALNLVSKELRHCNLGKDYKPIELIKYKWKYLKKFYDKGSLLACYHFFSSTNCSAADLNEKDYYKNWNAKEQLAIDEYSWCFFFELCPEPETPEAKCCGICFLITYPSCVIGSISLALINGTDMCIIRPLAASCGFLIGAGKDLYLSSKTQDRNESSHVPQHQVMI